MAAQPEEAVPPRGRLDALREFLAEESASGIVLVVAAFVALVWANSPWADSYVHFWHHELTLGIGRLSETEDLQHWVNDGLMVIFFFVVGLEIKRELAVGELRGVRAATLPALAALGGVVVPVVLFLVLAAPQDRGGWGVPMATDIAFAVGVLALVGAGTTSGAKLFLLSVAIVDDILAIVVIALVYSGPLDTKWLLLAVAAVAAMVVMRRLVSSPWPYVVPGFLLWVALLESGVHATLAGVALGLLTPASPVRGRTVLVDLEHGLHPVSAFVVVPVFALANAGVYLRGGVLADALGARLTWAVAVGLVVGKLVGIWGATAGALRARLGTLPAGTRRSELPPVAALGGIGFTVALFVAGLAFADPLRRNDAKIGIFLASVVAALLGAALLRLVARRGDGRRSA